VSTAISSYLNMMSLPHTQFPRSNSCSSPWFKIGPSNISDGRRMRANRGKLDWPSVW
jgi:hypothetical protein